MQAAVDIDIMLRELINKAVNEENYFSFSLPFFHAGTSNNVIAEFAEIKGTFRSVDCEFTENL